MTDTKQTNVQGEKQADSRSLYVPPALKEFGPVGALTQAGSMGAPEPGPGGTPEMF